MRKLILLAFLLVACTSAAPKRDFSVTLYESDYNCLDWFDPESGTIKRSCKGESGHPDNIREISLGDYQKERDFQALLINRCRRWKD